MLTPAARIQNLALRLTSQLDRITTVNSASVASQWIKAKAVSPDHVRIVPNGVVITNDEDKGKQSDRFVWLAMGRLDIEKDFFSLIDAMEQVSQRYPQCLLRVVGDGPLRCTLEELIRRKGLTDHVVLEGERTDVQELYRAANAVVLSSAWEGMPNVVLESLATGVPVVTTDVGGVTDIVIEGKSGFVVPPHSSTQLAEGMIRMMSLSQEKRDTMGQRGRVLVKKKYDMDTVVRQWESLYTEVLESKRG